MKVMLAKAPFGHQKILVMAPKKHQKASADPVLPPPFLIVFLTKLKKTNGQS